MSACSLGTRTFFSTSLLVSPSSPSWDKLLDHHLLPDASYPFCSFNIPVDKNSNTPNCSFLDLSFPIIIFSICFSIHFHSHILDFVFNVLVSSLFLNFCIIALCYTDIFIVPFKFHCHFFTMFFFCYFLLGYSDYH